MKVSELKRALTYVGNNDDIEFLVNDKGLTHVAEPAQARITTEWEVPERGDLRVTPDELPKTLTLFLEI